MKKRFKFGFLLAFIMVFNFGIATAATAKSVIPGGEAVGVKIGEITGLGTVSYFDPSANEIYAIGHKVFAGKGAAGASSEATSAGKTGFLYKAKILAAEEELKGSFTSGSLVFGEIFDNSDKGIRAKAQNYEGYGDAVEIGYPEKGKATILATVDGAGVREFNIEIEKVLKETKERNISVKVADAKLIAKTGGIIGGMSGAPIMQKGKMVGVITHTCVNEPQFGYGRTIE